MSINSYLPYGQLTFGAAIVTLFISIVFFSCMCFHYSLTKEKAIIEIQLGANWDDDWTPVNYTNGFSFPAMPVITQKEPGRIQMFNWGLNSPLDKNLI